MKILLLLTSLSFISFERFANKTNIQITDNHTINLGMSIDNCIGKGDAKVDEDDTAPVNINEVLWLKKKYNIVRLRPHCLMTEEEHLAIKTQQEEIFLKYGNTFWQKIEEEVALIEKKGLGFKKAKLSDLEKYLKRNNCTSKISEIQYGKFIVARTQFKLGEDGKIINIQLDTQGYYETHFGKDNCMKFQVNLMQILTKTRLYEPSTFLNRAIEDTFFIDMAQLK